MAVASFAFISLNLSNLMDSFLVLYLLSTSTLAGTSHVFRVPQLIFLISTAFLPDLEYGWEAGVTLFFLQQWVHKLFGAPGKNKASLVAQRVKNLSVMQKTRVLSLGQEDPLEEGMATHASISIWRIPWTEEGWWATSQWGCKELDTTDFHFFFFFLFLEESTETFVFSWLPVTSRLKRTVNSLSPFSARVVVFWLNHCWVSISYLNYFSYTNMS